MIPAGLHVTKLETRLTLDHQKFLGLAVVVMATPGNAGVRRKVGELATVGCFKHFHKHATRVGMLRHGVGVHRQLIAVCGGQQSVFGPPLALPIRVV